MIIEGSGDDEQLIIAYAVVLCCSELQTRLWEHGPNVCELLHIDYILKT